MGMPVNSAWQEELVDFSPGHSPERTEADWLHTFNHLPSLKDSPQYFYDLMAPLGLGDKLKLFVLPLSEMSSANGKTMPAFELLRARKRAGTMYPKTVYVVPSSGNTLFSIARLAKIYPEIAQIIGVMDSSVPPGKIAHPEFMDAAVEHPSIVQPPDPQMTTIEYAYDFAKKHGFQVINQYLEDESWEAHQCYTGPHIESELWRLEMLERIRDPHASFAEANIIAAAGTTSTFLGCFHHSNDRDLGWKIHGAASISEEERISGSRTKASIEKEIKFDWKPALMLGDLIAAIDKKQSAATAKKYYRGGILAGLTAGQTAASAIWLMYDLHAKGMLDVLRNKQGYIVFVAIFMDGPIAYFPDFVKILGKPKALIG